MTNKPDGHFAVTISLLGCLLMFASGYAVGQIQSEAPQCSMTIRDQNGLLHEFQRPCKEIVK